EFGPRLEGGSVRDTVQPTPERRRLANGRRLASEDKESGLESILRVRLVGHHATADVPYHRAVPTEQNIKGDRISMVLELPEQILVGQLPPPLVVDDVADQLQHRAGRGLGHRAGPGEIGSPPPSSVRRLEEPAFF